ncbi:protein UXT isoform X2 [Festucalex cinctus]
MAPPVSSKTNANSQGAVESKVLQYERFIDEVLKKDLQCVCVCVYIYIFLRRVMEQRDAVYEQVSHYLQLKNTLQALQETDSQSLKADVDLGCNFYVQAKVEDSSKIFVLVGFGFFVEMDHTEALRFIDKKTNQLTAVCENFRVWQSFRKAAEEKSSRFVLSLDAL